ncbi:MAG TPA: NAD(P)/FAD-dependent oxidoreductase [Opitutaceae bacterium]|nr:NAD(P)/FAD-dependent oxidoreductase [Opitutaceae bacterium]
MNGPRIVVAGGGAAGFFAALAAAEQNPAARITICEATARPLAKVRISGGGRCNVTHACFEPEELVRHYPRGGAELRGPLHRWGPRETVAWFAAHGVPLKTEADGRMFPVTDDSATVVDCLRGAAERAGIAVQTGGGVRAARPGFTVELATGGTLACDRLLLATGGTQGSGGLAIAAGFGHEIVPPVPSLFTFHVADPRLAGLAGVSVADAAVGVAGTRLRERGPVLITHDGLSGPAILRLSAWGARELHERGYRFGLTVSWTGALSGLEVAAGLGRGGREHPRKQVASWNPFGLPQRLWERLAAAAGVPPERAWSGVSRAGAAALARELAAGEFAIDGKSLFKEEFVTCGGVRRREVDFRTMESRLQPGLHFAGEVLDIDGLTGGFNLQSAWTTGRLAGRAMAGAPTGGIAPRPDFCL